MLCPPTMWDAVHSQLHWCSWLLWRMACRRMPYCTPSLAELHASHWDYWTLPEGVCRERRPSDRVTGELLVAWSHRMARDHHGP